MVIYYLIFLFSSFFLTLLAYKFFIPFLKKRKILDIPITRSAHKSPVPTGGGIIFFIIILLSSILCEKFFNSFELNIIILSTIPIVMISLIDDFRNIKIRFRLSAQIITSIILLSVGNIYIYDGSFLNILIFLLLILISTTTINVSNFIDGLDGLLTGSILIILLSSAFVLNIISPLLFIIIGSLLGFLYHNYHPAKIFMGDVGSIFLGCLYIGIAFQSKDLQTLFSIILLGTPLFADSLVTILRRLINLENIFTAHKLQLFQRLHQAGWNQRRISGLYFSNVFCISFGLILFGIFGEIIFAILSLLVLFYIDKKFAVPFLKIQSR